MTGLFGVPWHTPLYSSPFFDNAREEDSREASPSMRGERPRHAVFERPRWKGHLVELQAYPVVFRALA